MCTTSSGTRVHHAANHIGKANGAWCRWAGDAEVHEANGLQVLCKEKQRGKQAANKKSTQIGSSSIAKYLFQMHVFVQYIGI